jgi:hypothetical protein
MKIFKLLSVAFLFSTIMIAENVTLKNSTIVVVKSTGQISSTNFSQGQEIIFNVAQDVNVKSGGITVTVISAGTAVYGTVQESKKPQMAGAAGKIVVALNSTTAVDGSNIALSGTLSNSADSEMGTTVAMGVILCPLFLLNKGEDGVIPVGAQVRAMVLGSFEIEVN